MRQVDKKNFKIMLLISLASIFFIVGCSTKNDYPKSVKYFDNNISKDNLLHAAKKVFYFADKEAFMIDAYRNDLNVTKSKADYKLYTMDIQNDHFDFNVDQNNTNKSLKATLSIYRTYGVDDDKPYYLQIDDSTYKLFWDRVSYFLGQKEDWNSCGFYNLNGYLCDTVDLEDKSAVQKDIITLNPNTNIIKEKISIKTAYTMPKNDGENSKSDNFQILSKHPGGSGLYADNNATYESFKIEKYNYVDKNSSKRYNNMKNKREINKK